jgi:hypothetical protein
MRRVWLIGSLALVVAAGASWTRFLQAHAIVRPATPIDLAQPQFAAYWRFLHDARRIVASGSSYTIHAKNAEEETQLFVLSAGLFGDVRPDPRTFVWSPVAGGGEHATYVLVYGSAQCPADATRMQLVENGAVCIRERP